MGLRKLTTCNSDRYAVKKIEIFLVELVHCEPTSPLQFSLGVVAFT
jgi:hypothetical protein